MEAFFSYVGSKRRLLPVLLEHVPNRWNQYCEPFLGGGSLFLALEPKKAILNDVNKNIIDIFRILKKNPEKVIEHLKRYGRFTSEKRYYLIRGMDRTPGYKKMSNEEKAVRMIYLACACFNGVLRFNSKGECNSPFGKGKHPLSKRKIQQISEVAMFLKENKGIRFTAKDYATVFTKLHKFDFVYLDPPYHEDYTYGPLWKQQKEIARLLEFCHNLDRERIFFMLSIKATPQMKEVFKKFNIHEFTTPQLIAMRATARFPRKELLVTNY